MKARKHTEDEVRKSLRQKNDVSVDGKLVKVLSDTVYSEKVKDVIPNPAKRNDLGNGSWGKIDYLVNHCGFSRIFVNHF